MFLDAWRGFGEKMSDTLAGAPERWVDGRYAEAVKSSSSGPFWIWAHQREEGHGFRARAAGPRLAHGPEGACRSRGRSTVCVALCGPPRPQCSYLAPR